MALIEYVADKAPINRIGITHVSSLFLDYIRHIFHFNEEFWAFLTLKTKNFREQIHSNEVFMWII